MKAHLTTCTLLIAATAACGSNDPIEATIDAPPIDGAIDGAVDAPIDAPGLAKRVFVTSTKTGGDLKTAGAGADGLDGADKLCAARAATASLGGQWVAWLSTSTVNAIDRLPNVGPWYLVNRTSLVFASKAAIPSLPMTAISMTETGAFPSGTSSVWTGTSTSGIVVAGITCIDWTSSDIGSGREGLHTEVNASWTSYLAIGAPCNQLNRLYCFEK